MIKAVGWPSIRYIMCPKRIGSEEDTHDCVLVWNMTPLHHFTHNVWHKKHNEVTPTGLIRIYPLTSFQQYITCAKQSSGSKVIIVQSWVEATASPARPSEFTLDHATCNEKPHKFLCCLHDRARFASTMDEPAQWCEKSLARATCCNVVSSAWPNLCRYILILANK